MRLLKIKRSRFVVLIAAFAFLCGCSGYSETAENELSEDSAVVNYTCISNHDSKNRIFVILKNYHGN